MRFTVNTDRYYEFGSVAEGLPYDRWEEWLRGRTNAELREAVAGYYWLQIEDLNSVELREQLWDAYTYGSTAISDLSREDLIKELLPLHEECP